jgi:hypothetical protein
LGDVPKGMDVRSTYLSVVYVMKENGPADDLDVIAFARRHDVITLFSLFASTWWKFVIILLLDLLVT